MAVALRPEVSTQSVDEVVAIVWSKVLDGTYKNAPESVRALWHSFVLADDDLRFLALLGLTSLAKREQRDTRHIAVGDDGESGPRPAIGYGAPHGKKRWAKYIALTWPYEAADGTQKSLLDFTREDLMAFSESRRRLAATYESHADWAEEASGLLASNTAERLRDLPMDVLERVNASALDVLVKKKKKP